MNRRRIRFVFGLLVLVACALAVLWRPVILKHPDGSVSVHANPLDAVRGVSAPRPTAHPTPAAILPRAASTGAPPAVVRAKWGSGPGELGRDRPKEGNPEAPMSVTVDGEGRAVVLDQVNGRIVRFGP